MLHCKEPFIIILSLSWCRSICTAERLAFPILDRRVSGWYHAGGQILSWPKQHYLVQMSWFDWNTIERDVKSQLVHPSSWYGLTIEKKINKSSTCKITPQHLTLSVSYFALWFTKLMQNLLWKSSHAEIPRLASFCSWAGWFEYYLVSKIYPESPLMPKFQDLRASVAEQAGLSITWSATLKAGFLITWLFLNKSGLWDDFYCSPALKMWGLYWICLVLLSFCDSVIP